MRLEMCVVVMFSNKSYISPTQSITVCIQLRIRTGNRELKKYFMEQTVVGMRVFFEEAKLTSSYFSLFVFPSG